MTAFLLALSGMPLIFCACFIVQQKIIQHEAKEKLESSLLQTIVVKENDFSWVKQAKEIYIKGKLFDIKSFELKNGAYRFTGLYDEEEDSLNQALNDGMNEQSRQLLSSIFQILLSVFIKASPDLLITGSASYVYSPLILPHISFPFRNIPTPPPQRQAVSIEQISF